MTLAAHAETIADEAMTIGRSCAVIVSATWRSGADPEIAHGLVGAAMSLGSSPLDLHQSAPPMPDDKTFVQVSEELWAETGALIDDCADLRRAAKAQLADAQRAAESRDQAVVDAARRQAADAMACVDILDLLKPRLEYAAANLSAVPDDLESVYEAPYDLVRRGGQLPHAGAFLTGAAAAPDRTTT